MTKRARAIAAGAFVALNLALLGPQAGDPSPLVDGGLHLQAEAILDGSRPYSDRRYEYPPLSIPVVVAPGLISDSPDGYRTAFAWEMVAWAVAIILMLALLVPGGQARVIGALGAFTIGLNLLSGIGPLPDSDIDSAPLALARFDLVPAALVLAACFARLANRSATWSALLSLGTAVKAYPAMLFPSFLRGEGSPRRVVVGVVTPLAIAACLVLASGDSFASAVSYHTGRGLQVESIGANVLILGHLLGDSDLTTEVGAGAWNLIGSGTGVARGVSLAFMAAAWLALVFFGWRRRAPLLPLTTAILATTIVLAPVLSPQFLLWVLPVAAAAFGFGAPSLILLVAIALTQLMLGYYDGVDTLTSGFGLTLTARNLALLAFAGLACWEALRTQGGRAEGPARTGSQAA